MANADDSCPEVPAGSDRDGDCVEDGEDPFPDDPDQGMVRIAAGEFWMGSPGDEANRGGDEERHRVGISRPYLIKATEVTQAEWEAVMGDTPSRFGDCGGSCPVETVSWYGAVEFCNALSRSEGLEECYAVSGQTVTWPRGLDCLGYRLPTEAEWEYAVRAGTDTAYHTGADAAALDRAGWYERNSGGRTHPVEQKEANAWGLYDMHGNVWEWVWDAYRQDYEALSASDPHQDAGVSRVYRGGSWGSVAQGCRAANRSRYTPSYRSYYLGFRPARSIVP